MKIKDIVSFPHPVLREEKDDYESSKFETKVFHKKIINKYLIGLTLNLKNKELLELIEKNKAKIICHMECSRTKFRDIEALKLGENEFMIHAGEIDGMVYLLPLIVANEDITNYYSKDFNKDYGKKSFKIKKGDFLAIGKHFPITIEKERDKLANVPSIFLIDEHDNPSKKETRVILTEEKINIFLPKETYKIYRKYRKKQDYQNILNSIIFLPSLIHTLDELKELNGNSMEYGDKRWFIVLTKKLKEIKIDFQNQELTEKDTFILAQEILEYLNSKSIDSLMNLEKEEDEE